MVRATLTIDRLSKLGDGAASYQGRTVFIEGALPHEEVEVEVDTQATGKALHGRLVQVTGPSPSRRQPPCPLAARCGGCDWLHADEALQREAKQEIVLSALEFLGGIARGRVSVGPMVVSPRALGYRRRAVMHLSKGRLGFFGRQSHAFVEVATCPALVPALADLPGRLSPLLGALANDGEAVHLLAENDAVAMAVLLDGPVKRRHLEACDELMRTLHLAGVVLSPKEGSPNVLGRPALKGLSPLTPAVPVYLRPDAFAQANGEANVSLVAAVAQALAARETDRVLELFCGNGNFSFVAAKAAASVLAVEASGTAIELASRSAREGEVRNVRFVQGEVDKVCRGLAAEGERFDLLLADPPRTGAPGLAGLARKFKVRRVVYVSCDAASLARDGSELVAAGFEPKTLQLVDMFPQTRHAEAVMAFDAALPKGS